MGVEETGAKDSIPAARTKTEAPNLLSTLLNGLAILDLFNREHREWSLDEMSQKTGLRKANVYRLARTLAYAGYLIHEPTTGKYRLGPTMLRSIYLVTDYAQIVREARPYLEELAHVTDETVTLSANVDGVSVNLDTIRTMRPFLSTMEVAFTLGDTANSAAKLFAALTPQANREIILNKPRRQWTPRTVVDTDALSLEFERVRTEGIAFDMQESAPGTCAVSAPVRNQFAQVVGALSVVVPAGRFGPEERKSHARAVKAAAERFSEYIGFSPAFRSCQPS